MSKKLKTMNGLLPKNRGKERNGGLARAEDRPMFEESGKQFLYVTAAQRTEDEGQTTVNRIRRRKVTSVCDKCSHKIWRK